MKKDDDPESLFISIRHLKDIRILLIGVFTGLGCIGESEFSYFWRDGQARGNRCGDHLLLVYGGYRHQRHHQSN